MSQNRERYHFIHNVFANFYKDTLDWITTIYPRFEYRVVSNYDKAVEFIQKSCQYDRETDMPMLPALILNPNGDFEPADANAGGAQMWRYPNLSPTLSKRLFEPIYRDEHVTMNTSFIRIKGEIELIMLLNSFYEYCDIRMLFINMFGGLNRIIYPIFFSSFIILPDSFKTYKYENDYTGVEYDLDWTTSGSYNLLVKSTARNEVVLPLNVKPQLSLQGLSDASNRYGGTDNIAEWKLGATINYEIEIPNYLVIESDYLAERIDFEIRYGSAYSKYNDYQPPDNRTLYNFKWDWGLNFDTNSPDKLDIPYPQVDTTSTFVGDFVYDTRYLYEVTQEKLDATDGTAYLYIDLTSVEQITFPKILIVNSKDGALAYGDHYEIINNGWTLMVKQNDTVFLKVGWFLELFIYKLVVPYVIVPEAGSCIDITNLGLVCVTTEECSDTVPEGDVIRQNPIAGKSVIAGSTVNLVISTGQPTVPEATSCIDITNVGLVCTTTNECSDTVPEGDVIRQAPIAGSTVPCGSTVNLVISTGQPIVPEATSCIDITNVGLVCTTSEECSDTVPEGDMISQNPITGSTVACGSTVNLVMSTGQPTVPEATSCIDITDVGLVCTTTEECSDTVSEGDVISQDPIAGTTVTCGSTVNLLISTGVCPPPTLCLGYGDTDFIREWNDTETITGAIIENEAGAGNYFVLEDYIGYTKYRDGYDAACGQVSGNQHSNITYVWLRVPGCIYYKPGYPERWKWGQWTYHWATGSEIPTPEQCEDP